MPRRKYCHGQFPCKSYLLTQKEFRNARWERWDYSFRSTFGKLATKLYRQRYEKEPPQRFSPSPSRDPVNVYPCGILEEAYRQLRAQGVPLAKPESKSGQELAEKAYDHWAALEYAWVKAWESQDGILARDAERGSTRIRPWDY